MDIGNKIKMLRKEKGLTQNQLANAVGVTTQAVSKWERGENQPDVSLIIPICSVLGVSADRLLGGFKNDELEKRFQRSIHLGEEGQLIVCEDAIREFPDSETWLYRLGVSQYHISILYNDTVYLNRAMATFKKLEKLYPKNDFYRHYMARIYKDLGMAEKAKELVKEDEDMLFILEGEELKEFYQKRMEDKIYSLIRDLRNYGTREALEVCDKITCAYFGEGANVYGARWFNYLRLASEYYEENNVEKGAECMEKAYFLAKSADEIRMDMPYCALTDKLPFEKEVYRTETDQFLTCCFDRPGIAELKKKILDEHYKAFEFKKNYVGALLCFFDEINDRLDDSLIDYSAAWHLTEKDNEDFHSSYIKESKHSPSAPILFKLRKKEQAIDIIEKGIMQGITATLGGNHVIAFVNCREKSGYAAIPIGEMERKIPTAPCGDDRIFAIASMHISYGFRDCQLEKYLVSDVCRIAKEKGMAYVEGYIRYGCENEEQLMDIYCGLGFEAVREFDNKGEKGVILLKKL